MNTYNFMKSPQDWETYEKKAETYQTEVVLKCQQYIYEMLLEYDKWVALEKKVPT